MWGIAYKGYRMIGFRSFNGAVKFLTEEFGLSMREAKLYVIIAGK